MNGKERATKGRKRLMKGSPCLFSFLCLLWLTKTEQGREDGQALDNILNGIRIQRADLPKGPGKAE